MENVVTNQPTQTLTTRQKLKSKYLSSRFVIKVLYNIVLYILVIGICFNIAYPVILSVCNAFKSEADFRNPAVTYFSKNPTMGNINAVITEMNVFGNQGAKTLLLALLISLLQVASCTVVAYGFARFKFKGNGLLFTAVILVLVIPPQTTILPLIERFKAVDLFGLVPLLRKGGETGLLGTFWPQILLAATCMGWKNGLYIFMLRQYFRGVPMVLEEAAYIDGARTFKAFFKVMLPSAIPMMMTVFLFSFCWQWTDNFYTQFMPSPAANEKLLAMQVSTYYNDATAETMDTIMKSNQYTTSVMVLLVPLVILFLFTQQFFVEGVERSGIVG